MCGAEVQVTNCGSTPARVTDVRLRFLSLPVAERLPAVPDYGAQPKAAPHFFLVGNDHFFHTDWVNIGATAKAAKDGAVQMWVLGYVDYIDTFGQRHRSGYARVYNHTLDVGRCAPGELRTNLEFVTQDSYNYDRPRERGEGNDWGDRTD